MKQFNFFKAFLTPIVFALLMVTNFTNAQQTNSAIPNETQGYVSGHFGPTLVIASALPYSVSGTDPYAFMHSRLYTFGITGSFVMVRVDFSRTAADDIINNSQQPAYKYLNDAINGALAINFRRIIILEGEYQVDNSIIINKIAGASENYKSYGKITIEGEGYGTRIVNAPTYLSGPIFDIRSSYNTIKNMSIISDTGGSNEGKNTCINITATTSTGKIKNNVFENLYLGAGGLSYLGNTAPPNATLVGSSSDPNDGALALDAVNNRIGIKLEATGSQIENNKFRNISCNSLDKGMVIAGASGIRVTDNVFENFNFDNVIVGIDFATGVYAFDNVFQHMSLQTDTYTKNFVRKVSGTRNVFRGLNNSDWNAGSGGNNGQPNIKYITLSATSSFATITDSEFDHNATTHYFHDYGSSYTQFINNSVNAGLLSYKIGLSDASNTSSTEILGKLFSTHNNGTQLTADKGRVIIGNTNDALFTELNTQDPNKNYKLIVNGKVRVKEEVYVKSAGLTWPDYVFAKNYKLMPLNEVEKHIQGKGYLPNMPSAQEVEKVGIAVGDLIKRQQEKIEELTLYLIEMKKEIEALKQPKN